ncbi:hypothetical protein AWN90_42135 [Nocardia terpenica]|uniref:Antirepressor protein C-terminal domain-containing protein n=2 Tax=Nocardia terpenica TaxID=455432 RepID=A0A164K7H5_9NOCA|nr:hypothetical protein AWN90_42135 [Nocardia terpenica]
MPLMGYTAWRNFMVPLERAMKAAANQGHDATSHFAVSRKVVGRQQGGGTERADYELSRFAAYLVAMNGDPNKAEVAAAQAYFAIQTRHAEVARPFTREELLARAVLESADVIAEQKARIAARDAKIAIDAPKVAAFEEFLGADGTYGMAVVADMLGWGRNTMLKRLREVGVLSSQPNMWNVPLRRHMKHFKIVAYAKDGTERGYTTYVRPSGVEFIRNTIGVGTGAASCSRLVDVPIG